MSRPTVLIMLAMTLLLGAPGAHAEEDLRFFRQLHSDGLHEVAASQMESFLARNPRHGDRPEMAYLLGRSYEALGQAGPMLRWLDEFVVAMPADPRACPALYDAALAGARAGLLAESEPLVERLLRDYPDCAQHDAAILLAARIKRGRGDTAAALQMLSYLVESAGENELLGRALYERAGIKGERDAAAAIPDLEQLKASLPRHPLAGFAALQLAEQALEQGRADAALAELDWTIDNFDEAELSSRALETRSRLLEAEARPKAAARDLEELRKRHPERARELGTLPREVVLLAAAGEGKRAVERAMEHQAESGESAESFALLGEALESAERAAQAAEAWRRCAEFDPVGPTGLRALDRTFRLAIAADDETAVATAAGRLLARLPDADARAELLIDLGDFHARAERPDPARRAWERVETEASGSGLLPEALFRLARLAEGGGEWRRAAAHYDRLRLEFGASGRGIEAQGRRDALGRYYGADPAAATEKLLAILEEERRQGEVRGRDFRVGKVLLEELKDFPRAAEYFSELSVIQSTLEGQGWARLLAGRAALREKERLVLAGDAAAAKTWRERALNELQLCRTAASPEIVAEADYELTLLRLDEQPAGPDRLPILDAYLANHGNRLQAAHILYERGELYRNERWTEPRTALERAVDDHERALELAPAGEWALRARLGAGLAALALEQHDRAASHFRKLIETAPGRYEGGEARFGLGRIEESRKRFRKALSHYQAFLDASPTSPRRARCLIHIGDCHYFLRDWDGAEASYGQLLAEYTDGALVDDARYRLALTAEQRGEALAARDQLQALLASGAPRFRREAAWRLGKAAEAEGRTAEALAALRALRDEGWTGAHAAPGGLLLGSLLLEQGQGSEARGHYDSLLARVDLGDERPRARAEQVRAMLLAGDFEAAEANWTAIEAEGALVSEEERARVLLAFGRERAAAGEAAAALARFDLCLQRHPGSEAAPWALYESALIAARARDFDAALVGFEELARRYPESGAARRGAEKAGGILYSQGDFEAASTRFEWAVARTEQPSADLLYHSALALEKRGDPRTALERTQRFLARMPEDERVPEAMMKIGYYMQGLGQFERAILAYRNAELFQDREGKARLHFWIGDCFQAMGERQEALAAFLKVGYLYGDQGLWGVTSTLRAAALYEGGGDLAQARQLFAKVLAGQGRDSDFGRTAAEALERIDARLSGGGTAP